MRSYSFSCYHVPLVACAFCLALCLSTFAYACPQIAGIPDVNCDGELRIAVIGDSLVVGFGDTRNDNHGGYVTRAAAALPLVQFSNLGKLGAKTRPVYVDLARKLRPTSLNSTKAAVFGADIIVLDLGRNDRWSFGLPSETHRRLKRIARLITSRAISANLVPPVVVTAVMMLPNRGSQGPWVKELNALILESSTNSYPCDLRFDLVSKRLLSIDQIHPTPKGYTALAAVFKKYLVRKLPRKIAAARPS